MVWFNLDILTWDTGFFKDCPNTLDQGNGMFGALSATGKPGTIPKDRTSRHKASAAVVHCVCSRRSWLDRWLRDGDRCLEEVAFSQERGR